MHSHDVGGKEGSEDANDDAASGDHERVVECVGSDELLACCRDDKAGAGGLGERAEQVRAHASNVADVVANVVCDDTWVHDRVLVEVLDDLTDEISTDIGGLGVNSTTNAPKQGDSGAAKAVAGDSFEHLERGLISVEKHLGSEDLSVGDDQEDEHEEGEAHKGEAEDQATAEGHIEAPVKTVTSLFRCAHIGAYSNLHADVTRNDRSEGTEEEGDGGVGHHRLLLSREEDNHGEDENEDNRIEVFLLQESAGTVLDQACDFHHLVFDGLG
mmetsp:Transcript_22860/g.28385  ORF Transcript_22860/g.28385 Transcript_22860/m.28385 type:complete len:271 (-) Transcript_22860:293-1105(-)